MTHPPRRESGLYVGAVLAAACLFPAVRLLADLTVAIFG